MVLNNVFQTNELISKALHATQLRNSVITHNIANVDVPGFRRGVVEFESYFQNELDRSERTGSRINTRNIQPSLSFSNENLPHRLDGNNVDIEHEMVSLYQNSARYETMAISLMNNYRRINVVLNSNI